MSNLKTFVEKLDVVTMKMLLLWITALVYPPLADLGASFRAPVLIHFSEQTLGREFLASLRSFAAYSACDLGEKPKSIERILSDKHTMHVFGFSQTRYTYENLQALEAFCRCSALSGDVQSLILVVAPERISSSLRSFFAGEIYVDARIENLFENVDAVAREIIVTVMEYQRTIWFELRRSENEYEPGVNAFAAAAEVLRVAVSLEGADAKLYDVLRAKIDDTLTAIEKEWSTRNDAEMIADIFRDCFVQWAENLAEPILMSCRSDVGGDASRFPTQGLLFDYDFYYLPCAVFEEIVAPMADMGTNYLKEKLSESGMLITQGNTRNHKTCLITISGKDDVGRYTSDRRRFVKLRREAIDRDGKLSILELLQSKGETDHD